MFMFPPHVFSCLFMHLRVRLVLSELNVASKCLPFARQRGCNGMSYTMDYTDKVNKFDEVPIMS